MMKALLLVGASVAVAQECSTIMNSSGCSAANCTWVPGSCSRSLLPGKACAQTMMMGGASCNATDGCSNFPVVTNATSCGGQTYCIDNLCAGKTNATCSATDQCTFSNDRCTTTPQQTCDNQRSKDTCVGLGGCVWIALTQTFCNSTQPNNLCMNCSETPAEVRSAVNNYKSRTCTWPAVNGYASPFIATIVDVAQSSSCSALMAANATNDYAVISSAAAREFFGYNGQYPYDASSNVSCTAASPTPGMGMGNSTGNSASSVIPGLAFLVVAALM